MKKVAIDAMGGDNAPAEVVRGAVRAVQQSDQVQVILVGREEIILPLLSGENFDPDRLIVRNATEVIETGDHPVMAIRSKKDSSMHVGMKMVRDAEADAFVSAGNSGALMVGAQVLVGRQKGVDRAPFAHMIPHRSGQSLLLDCGANVDCRPEHLVEFAKLGTRYMEENLGIAHPTVGLVNIGAEENKGNALVKDALPLLQACEEIHFIGSVEPTDITEGKAQIIVCDGFVGNVIIKLYEGMGKLMMQTLKDALMSSFLSKLGALLVKKPLKKSLKGFDSKEFGGAPILGLKGLVIKTHGNAHAEEFCNSILQCVK